MKSEILRLLKESDDYVSGQQLCERFQVSRTAVWKVVDQLKKEGYEIEAVPRKGYRLVESPDVLSEAELESLRSTKWAGKSIFVFKELIPPIFRPKQAEKKESLMVPCMWRKARVQEEEDGGEAGSLRQERAFT